jgi:hypothetical protein
MKPIFYNTSFCKVIKTQDGRRKSFNFEVDFKRLIQNCHVRMQSKYFLQDTAELYSMQYCIVDLCLNSRWKFQRKLIL